MPHCILLAGNPIVPTERPAAEAITPGHLVHFAPSGTTAGQLLRHWTSGGDGAPWFARERLMPDRGTTAEAIDRPYVSGETVNWLMGATGDKFYAFLASGAAAVQMGDPLCSNGDGTLTLGVPGTDVIVADAAEAKVGAITGPVRLRVYAR
jgi:hypothetical protein